jgi:hypothetical protein
VNSLERNNGEEIIVLTQIEKPNKNASGKKKENSDFDVSGVLNNMGEESKNEQSVVSTIDVTIKVSNNQIVKERNITTLDDKEQIVCATRDQQCIGSAETTNFFSPIIETFLMGGNMKSRVELLSSAQLFLDLQFLLVSVEKLIRGGKLSGLGDSNVMQFKKDCIDITFGVWEDLISGKKKVEKAINVNQLKNQVIQFLQTSKAMVSSKIC